MKHQCSRHETINLVVVACRKLQEAQTSSSPRTRGDNIRCQRGRMGGSLPEPGSPRSMATPHAEPSVEYSQTQGGLPGLTSSWIILKGEKLPNPNGQQSGSSIHSETMRYQKQYTTGRNSILEWAQLFLSDLRAVCVPAAQNLLADCLSREFLLNNEWSLNHQAFSLLTETSGNSRYRTCCDSYETPSARGSCREQHTLQPKE